VPRGTRRVFRLPPLSLPAVLVLLHARVLGGLASPLAERLTGRHRAAYTTNGPASAASVRRPRAFSMFTSATPVVVSIAARVAIT
jgi:hypothetical protein